MGCIAELDSLLRPVVHPGCAVRGAPAARCRGKRALGESFCGVLEPGGGRRGHTKNAREVLRRTAGPSGLL